MQQKHDGKSASNSIAEREGERDRGKKTPRKSQIELAKILTRGKRFELQNAAHNLLIRSSPKNLKSKTEE